MDNESNLVSVINGSAGDCLPDALFSPCLNFVIVILEGHSTSYRMSGRCISHFISSVILADLPVCVGLFTELSAKLAACPVTCDKLMNDACWCCLPTRFLFFFFPAPDSTSGVISKTIEICLHKEGNSFGFVMRGKCIH